jgi:L-rhamnose isomerase
MEDSKSLPWGAVWEEYCRRNETPADGQWLAQARDYESRVLSKR